jgi:hypothetical protein
VWVGQRLAGDGFGVLDVGLGPTTALAPLGGAVGLDLSHVIAGGGERKDERPTEKARTLDTDTVDRQLDPEQKRQKLIDPLLADGKRFGTDHSAAAVEDRDRRGILMRVDSGNTVLVGQRPFLSAWPILGSGAGRRRRQIWVESWQALFKPGTAGLRSRGQPDTSNQRQPRGVNSVQSQGWPP